MTADFTLDDEQLQIQKMREYPELLERNQETWTDDEREQLRKMYNMGEGITQIALKLQRTETAIVMQLIGLNLVRRSSSRYRAKKHSRCLCGTCEFGPNHLACPRYLKGEGCCAGTMG